MRVAQSTFNRNLTERYTELDPHIQSQFSLVDREPLRPQVKCQDAYGGQAPKMQWSLVLQSSRIANSPHHRGQLKDVGDDAPCPGPRRSLRLDVGLAIQEVPGEAESHHHQRGKDYEDQRQCAPVVVALSNKNRYAAG